MKLLRTLSLTLSTLVVYGNLAYGSAEPGEKAPNFSLRGHDGNTHSLTDYVNKDQYIVLEWFNEKCPFVKKHYGSNNMQNLQKEYTDKGVVWLSISSSAKGEQGPLTEEEAAKIRKEYEQQSTALLLDDSGAVGKLYGAKTTPHMYIINPNGEIVYNGAIDSNPSWRKATIKTAENYVSAALDASLAGKAIEKAKTKPYGCSVKY